MSSVSHMKICTAILCTMAIGGCTGSYEDDYYDDGYGAYYGPQAGQTSAYDPYSPYGAYGAFGQYGAFGAEGAYSQNADCAPGTNGRYAGGRYGTGGYTSGGLRYGGGAQTNASKSRYGSWESASAGTQGCGGYWVVPNYQIAQQPAPVVASAPIVTPTITTTVQQPCGDGQYRMDDGACAIMMTEEPEQYVPPQYVPPAAVNYPEVVTPTNPDWYQPFRK